MKWKMCYAGGKGGKKEREKGRTTIIIIKNND